MQSAPIFKAKGTGKFHFLFFRFVHELEGLGLIVLACRFRRGLDVFGAGKSLFSSSKEFTLALYSSSCVLETGLSHSQSLQDCSSWHDAILALLSEVWASKTSDVLTELLLFSLQDCIGLSCSRSICTMKVR